MALEGLRAVQGGEEDGDRTLHNPSSESQPQSPGPQASGLPLAQTFILPAIPEPNSEGAQFEYLRDPDETGSDLRSEAPISVSVAPSSELEVAGVSDRRRWEEGVGEKGRELERGGSSRLSYGSGSSHRRRNSSQPRSSPLSIKAVGDGSPSGLKKKRSSEPIVMDPRRILMEVFDREELRKKSRSNTIASSGRELNLLHTRSNQLIRGALQDQADVPEEARSQRYSDPSMPSTPLKPVQSRSEQSDQSSPRATDGDDGSSIFGLGIKLAATRALPYALSRPPLPQARPSSSKDSSPASHPPLRANSSFSDSIHSNSRSSIGGRLRGLTPPFNASGSPPSQPNSENRISVPRISLSGSSSARRSGGSTRFVQMGDEEDQDLPRIRTMEKGKKPVRGEELDGKGQLQIGPSTSEGFTYAVGSSDPRSGSSAPPPSVQSKEPTNSRRRKWYRGFILFCFVSSQVLYAALFFVFVAPFLWIQFHPAIVAGAAYLYLITAFSYLVAQLREPGSMPRGIHTDPPISAQRFSLENGLRAALQDSPIEKGVGKGIMKRAVPAVLRFGSDPRGGQSELQRALDASAAETPLKGETRTVQVERGGKKTSLVINEGKSLNRSPSRGRRLQNASKSQSQTPRRSSASNILIDPELKPRPRDYQVRGQDVIRTRWCESCQLYPPPRCYHCKICDHCVSEYQYHSTWLGKDVGARNLVPYTAFLLFSILSVIYTAIFCAFHLSVLSYASSEARFPGIHLVDPPGGSFKTALTSSPFSAVLCLVSFGSISFLFLPRLYVHIQCGLAGETVALRVSILKVQIRQLVVIFLTTFDFVPPFSPLSVPTCVCCSQMGNLATS